MECNKDEAARAKSIAEDKLARNDFLGAKKLALKAQTLYPGLDGISQMLTTLDVYVASENKVSGEMDWYGVLGVNPSADEETLKRQYRKLALMLHPDKNKSSGAGGAFRLISDAWNLLSDKAKRLAYNQRRGGFKVFQQRVSAHTAKPGFQSRAPMHTSGQAFKQRAPVHSNDSAPSRANGSVPSQPNGDNRNTPIPKDQSTSAKAPPPPNQGTSAKMPSPPSPFSSANAPPPPNQSTSAKAPRAKPSSQRTDTFWTICHRCNIYYEYHRVYLNNTLLCPNCKKPFIARETPSPVIDCKSQNSVPQKQQSAASTDRVPDRNVRDLGRNEPADKKPVPSQGASNSFKYQQDQRTGTGSVRSADPSIAAKAASVVQQAQDKLKRSYAESFGPDGSNGFTKTRKVDNMSYNSATPQGHGGFGATCATTHGPRIYGFSGSSYRQTDSARDLAPMETRDIPAVKAQKKASNKLNKLKIENAFNHENKRSKMCNKEKHSDENENRSDLTASKLPDQPENILSNDSAGKKCDNKNSQVTVMSVPDPDFYDFNQNRTESSFGDNEVWAVYGAVDGMPRFFALISKVISRKPLKLKISWLNSKTNSEFSSSTKWVGSGFYKTCGEFRVGKYKTCKKISVFSHKVNWSKGPCGTILILPQKGDVWALYKNWSADWNEHTPNEVIHEYDMVMVLDDYTEEKGVLVSPLTKVAGFKTLFRPNSDTNFIKTIPREEMFRFSHCVPNHVLTGQEAPNVPKGYVELDPAATPTELLQVITEANEDSTVPINIERDSEEESHIKNARSNC